MIIEEIVLEDNEADKKAEIQRYIGREVIVNDNKKSWQHGVLMDEKVDSKGNYSLSGKRYQLKRADQKRPWLFWYKDLDNLLIVESPRSK